MGTAKRRLPWNARRPVFLDDLPAVIYHSGGYALVMTVGRSKKARFAWGTVFQVLDTGGRFLTGEGLRGTIKE